MMSLVISIGQCGFDHSRITETLRQAFQAEVMPADTFDEALPLIARKRPALILVNRKLDLDGSDGLAIIRELRSGAATANLPVMLVSNYPEFQAQAVALGAAEGFGKAELQRPETLAKLEAFLKLPA